MSPLMVRMTEYNPTIYKIYEYVTSPIGVLNEYLKSPTYNFGLNSFNAFISLLNKFGANLYYSRYQQGYNIPIYTNVGTYIRELIQDFTIPGSVIVVFIFAFSYSKSFIQSIRRKTYISLILTIVFSTIIFMSFFVWFFRETVFWISSIFGIFIGIYLDKSK
jgi:oligosaccharide repeat unit polymerase